MNRRKFIVASVSLLTVITAAVTTRVWGKSDVNPTSSSNSRLSKDNTADSTKKQHYFSAHQHSLVATLASHIVPSDDTPGATEAKVADFIDQQVAKFPKKQKIYSQGLKRLDEYSQNKHGRDFLSLSDEQQYQILDEIFNSYYYQRRQKIDGALGRIKLKAYRLWDDMFSVGRHVSFFGELRRDTLEGFYTHPVGWKTIGYYGPPQPLGYPDYSNAPDVAAHRYETQSIRHPQNNIQGNNQRSIERT